MVRPWLAAVAILGCGLLWLAAYSWSVGFDGPRTVAGVARAAAVMRLEGIAMSLHLQRAEALRGHVWQLREEDARAPARRAARFELADALRDAAVLAEREGARELALHLLGEALQAAPERVDLQCLRTDLQTRSMPAGERRVELLRLVLRHDTACANLLAAQSFRREGDLEAAEAYLRRAAEIAPEWSRAHLALAQVLKASGHADGAQFSARRALEAAGGLHERLAAAALLRRLGGEAPEPWRLVAEHVWRSYGHVLLLGVALMVFVFHPGLASAGRSVAMRLRAQSRTRDSAS
ncbi:MAG: hypothetical protein ACP5KN_01680 [Armatimonadota bacterium]